MGKAKKFDAGKVDLSLVSPVLKKSVAEVMGFGAKKYGRYNYLGGGFTISRLLASTFRHLDAYQGGEDTDQESGLSHLAHAASNLQMIMDNLVVGTIEDDRFKLHREKSND